MADFNYHGPVVAFDLDDTLFRERDFCRSGFRFLCNLHKESLSPAETETLLQKMDAALADRENPFSPYEDIFKNKGLEGFDIRNEIEIYRNHLPESLHFSEEVEEVLENLSSRGIRMALVTDGRSGTQRRKIEALGLDRFIAPDLILISEETGYDKHSRNNFAVVVRAFPEAKGFFYIGDNPGQDFYQPNLMGWTTIQAPSHPDNVHPPSKPASSAYAPGHILTDFTDLIKLIP